MGRYPIYVTDNLSLKLDNHLKQNAHSSCVVLIDKKLTGLKVLNFIKKKFSNVLIICLASNENTKAFKNVYAIYSKLLKHGIDRNSLLISIGGGVIGDAAGFIASTYMRGIQWMQIPTTLLAQVDSSIGGKTAINHELGKNLVGTFYQPDAVFSDVSILKTLPKRELVAGMAETLKYGFALDSYFFKECLRDYNKVFKFDNKVLKKIVSKCIRIKSKLVEQDEKDTMGIRQFLNFGHTFGHAIEKYYNYQKFNHGEAVAVGMKFAVLVSYLRGMISSHDLIVSLDALNLLETPTLSKTINPKSLWNIMMKDKKNIDGSVKMVLLRSIGNAVANQPLEYSEFIKAFSMLRHYDSSDSRVVR